MLSFSLGLLLHSRGRFLRRRDLRPPYPISGRGGRIALAGTGAGAAGAYCEVYIDDGYALRALARRETPATIVDIGANIGCFAAFARVTFPMARIVAYEPDPGAFAQLAANLAGRSVELRRAAVGRRDGLARFAPGPDCTLGHLAADGALEVEVVAAAAVADGAPIDLLKLDCEGGEWEILAEPSLLARTRRVAMEYHLDDGRTRADLERLFAAGGHRVVTASAKSERFGMLQSERLGG